jgi:CheY-like chemotaxis protein
MGSKRILLVDDEPLVLRSMQKTLLRAGFEVETAPDCKTGLQRAHQALDASAPFDMAVLDLNMPGFDGAEASGAGLELLSRLLSQQPGLPVIILSAYDEVEKARSAINRGAIGYCVKGREQALLAQIRDVFPSS